MKPEKILPPFWFWNCLILCLLLHFLVPVHQLIPFPWNLLGVPAILLGFWLNIAADLLFKNHVTTVKPFQEPDRLILEGPFRISRNPMYLGMTLIITGLGVLLGSLTSLMPSMLIYLLLSLVYIPAEEVLMQQTFGRAYQLYCERVHRWIF